MTLDEPLVKLDPCGNVVLETYYNPTYPENKCDALVFVGGDTKPFVAAYGYDKQTGEWSHSKFYSFAWEAEAAANPRIIEDFSSPWEIEDIEEQLEAVDYQASRSNVSKVLSANNGKFKENFKDNTVEAGRTEIKNAIEAVKGNLELNN